MLAACLGVWLTYRASVTASGVGSRKAVSGNLAGSASCRQCHEAFYGLWAPSYHGLAMQSYTEKFASMNLTACEQEIEVGGQRYQAFIKEGEGYVLERDSDTEKRLPILHVLGGKNVYYFLTPLEKGRLQTLAGV